MFRPLDMFLLAILFLVGFVLLANFLLKLSSVIMSMLRRNQRESLEEILEQTRPTDERSETNDAEPMKQTPVADQGDRTSRS